MAKLHLQLLESSEKRTKTSFRQFLRDLPLVLDDTYKEVWLQIESQSSGKFELAKSVLTWVCYSREPIEATALQHALFAARIEDLECIDEEDLEDLDDLIQVCNGLVVQHKESNVIRFEHYTAEEFFPGYLADTLFTAHSTISRVCLRYLSMNSVTDISNSMPAKYLRYTLHTYSDYWNSQYPLMRYAVTSWGYHAKRSEIDENMSLAFVLEFLRRPRNVKIAARALDVYQPPEAEFRPRDSVIGLHLASFFGLRRTADQLISTKSLDLDTSDSFGWSALRWACHGRETEMVQYLIERGANVGIMDRAENTTLIWALGRRATHVSYKNLTIIAGSRDVLLSDLDPNTDPAESLSQDLSAKSLDAEPATLEELFHNASLNSRDVHEQPHISSRQGQFMFLDGASVVELSQLISIELGELHDASTMHDSPEPLRTSVEIVDLLIRYSGESINAFNAQARTALSLAAENQQFGIVDKLLGKGANIETVVQHNSDIPLLWALQSPRRTCEFANVTICGPVVAHLGHSLNVLTKSGGENRIAKSHTAITDSQKAVALRLIGNNINAVDFNGRTALSLGAESGYVEVVDALIRRNADVNLADDQGMTPLMYASCRFYPLKSSYQSLKVMNDATAILGTLALVHGSIARNTSQYNVDINARINIINMLLDAGASVDCENFKGHTAIDLARHTGWEAVLSILLGRKEMHSPGLNEERGEDFSTIVVHDFSSFGSTSGAWIGHYSTPGGHASGLVHEGGQQLHCVGLKVINATAIVGSLRLEDKNVLETLAQRDRMMELILSVGYFRSQ